MIDEESEHKSLKIDNFMSEGYREKYTQFKNYYKNKEYSLAKDILDEIGITNDIYILYYYGLIYFKLKNESKAMEHFKRVVALEENNFMTIQSYIFLSYIYCTRGNLKLAESCVDTILDIGIERAELYSIKGYITLEKKNYNEALNYYKKSLSLDNSNSNTQNSIGYVHLMIGNIEEGYNWVKQALEAKPNNYAFLHSMGYYYYTQKDYSNAVKFLNKSYELRRHPLTKKHLEISKEKL